MRILSGNNNLYNVNEIRDLLPEYEMVSLE